MPVTQMTDKYVIDREKGRGADVQPADAFEVSYQGAVLATRERNGYDDSDFYAVVWDGEKLLTVTYGTTRFWTYPNHAEPDATPEVLEAVRAWLLPQVVTARVNAIRRQLENPAVLYRNVVVVRGRKVAKGTTGQVDLVALSNYDNTERVRIRLLDGSHVWTAAKNCEVVDHVTPEDEDAIRQQAQRRLAEASGGDLAAFWVGTISAIPVL